ncbi:MAG: hypothetical protein PHY43_06005 [Verrucomicrobiales bacterium]|nr:hypothetical protein [Verrucomicrobiales bacterium]
MTHHSAVQTHIKSWCALTSLTLGLLLSASAEPATNAIQWGVNVHTSGSRDLADKLTQRNLKCVRMDLWGNDPLELARFRNAAEAYKAKNIKIEAILFTTFARDQARQHDTNASLVEVEATAYAQTKPQIERTKDLVQDYELQNEVSLYPNIKVEGSTGQAASDYDVPVGRMQAAALRGISRAIDEVRKTSHLPLRIILGTTDRSFGFLSFMQQQGVIFDVVGYHIYPWEKHTPLDQDSWYGPGGPLGQLAKFNKPIVINEFNSGEIYSGDAVHPGTNYENRAEAPMTELGFRSLDKHLRGLVNQKVAKVEAVIFYELCDEPKKEIPENRFGLFYDTALQKPKISLLIATSFAGGTLSPAEQNELTKRGLGLTNAPKR